MHYQQGTGIFYMPIKILLSHRAFATRYFPSASPPSKEKISHLNEFIANTKKLLIISGAGLSTESGIPDYRSKDVGLYDRANHKPMTHQEFMNSFKGRQRYWARNYLGWKKFLNHQPNDAHLKLSELEQLGKAHWHVTQNVDGLHTEAGSKNITELHGCMHRVVCLNCKIIVRRDKLQKRFDLLNRNWTANVSGYGPDADAFLKNDDVVSFQVPSCENCGGVLKPDVVFFGDNVPLETVDFVNKKVDKSDGILVVGSSLYIWSGYKFIVRATSNAIPVAAINVGPTRADKLFSLKIDALCTQVLSQITLKQIKTAQG